jgi:Predicted pyridoxal phosphate-dependent enzyme apparently involved in regulation of cell wall biogenesis
VRVSKNLRDELRHFLKKNNIFTGLHWYPLHKMSLFKKCKKGNLKNTNLVADELISLPFHARLSNNDLKKVCNKIRLFLNE